MQFKLLKVFFVQIAYIYRQIPLTNLFNQQTNKKNKEISQYALYISPTLQNNQFYMQQYARQQDKQNRQDVLTYLINNCGTKFLNITDIESDLEYFQEKDFYIFQLLFKMLIEHGYKCTQNNITYFMREIPKSQQEEVKTVREVIQMLEKYPQQIEEPLQLQSCIIQTFEQLEGSIFNSQINIYIRKQFIQIGQKLIHLFLKFEQQQQMIERLITNSLTYFTKQLFSQDTPPDISVLTPQILNNDKFQLVGMKNNVFQVILCVQIAKSNPLVFRQAMQSVENGQNVAVFQQTSPKKSKQQIQSPKRKSEPSSIKLQTYKLRLAASLSLERNETDPQAILFMAAFSQSTFTTDQAMIGLQALCNDYDTFKPQEYLQSVLNILLQAASAQMSVKSKAKSLSSNQNSRSIDSQEQDEKKAQSDQAISQQAQALLKATQSQKLRTELISSYGSSMPFQVVSERLFDISSSVRNAAFNVLKNSNTLEENCEDLLDELDFYEKDVRDLLIKFYLDESQFKLSETAINILHKADYKSQHVMTGDINRQIINLRFLSSDLRQQQLQSIAKIKNLAFNQKQRLLQVISQIQVKNKVIPLQSEKEQLDDENNDQQVIDSEREFLNGKKQAKMSKQTKKQQQNNVEKSQLNISLLNIKISDFKDIKDKILYWKCQFSSYEDWKKIYLLNSNDYNVLSGVPCFMDALSQQEINQLIQNSQKTLKIHDLCILLDEMSNHSNDLQIAKLFKEKSQISKDFRTMSVFLNSKSNILLDLEYMEAFLKSCIAYNNNEEVIDQLYENFNIKYVPNVSQKLIAIYFAISVLLQEKNKFYKPFERMLEALKAILDVTFKQTQNEKYTLSFVFYYYVFLINHCTEQNIDELKYVLEQFRLFFGADIQINTQLVQTKLGIKYNETKLAILQVFDTRITGSNKYPAGVFD